MKNLENKIDNFIPDYSLCTKKQKSIHFGVCDKMFKNTKMICSIGNEVCVAWKDYTHDSSLDNDYGTDSSFNFHRSYKK